MSSPISPAEFQQLKAPWDRKMVEIAEERLRTNYSRNPLEHFSDREARAMRAFLARLIPESEGVDLVGWMDFALGKPFGRGDWRPGMPLEQELFKRGLHTLELAAAAAYSAPFAALTADRQDEIVGRFQRGESPGGEVGRYFFERFYAKALHGYFGHPRVWMRIGFYGASYPEGYVWLGRDPVRMRHERAPGWDTL